MNGKDLKKIRQSMGKTQAEFAQMVHYEKNTISKMETGIRKITKRFEEILKNLKGKHARNTKAHRRKRTTLV